MLTAINSGDTAWMLMSAALVFLMTLGLAFFYGGLGRQKTILSILMQCLMVVCLVSLQWVLFGYSLAFGPDHNGWIGTLAWAGLRGVSSEPNMEYCASIPHQVFMIYQMMLALFTPALILGAFAERIKFSSFCLFTVLWTTLVYDPVAHWIWSVGGFLRNAGALDFAGGTVVHINAGMTALAIALVLGKRKDDHEPSSSSPLQNMPLAVLGAGILWLGWFGFNSGSALSAGGLAASAFLATHIAASTAGLTWAIIDWVRNKRPTLLGIITGAVGGLVAITPAAGFVSLWGAIGIGIGVSLICYVSIAIIEKKVGDHGSWGAFGVHGVGGIWGVLATGLWATKGINANGADGLFSGNGWQLLIQVKATLATALYSFVMSYILLKVVEALIGLRVSEPSGRAGLRQPSASSDTILD